MIIIFSNNIYKRCTVERKFDNDRELYSILNEYRDAKYHTATIYEVVQNSTVTDGRELNTIVTLYFSDRGTWTVNYP